MNQETQESFRPRIEARIQELRDNMNATAEDREAIAPDVAIGRLSRLDSMQMQQMALGMKQRMQEEIRRLEEALGRINNGRYGACELCGNDIPSERLEYQPDAITCVSCLNQAQR